jgi:protocatechuate 3,4-dioxygenase beta subunit
MTIVASQRTGHTEARPALHRTPGLLLGPFYPARAQSDSGVPSALIEADMPGRRLELSGRVLDARCTPLAGALVELWHADPEGRYRHPDDPRVAEVDTRFAGYTRRMTDGDGGWRVATLVPGVYTDRGVVRAPHVHVQVTHGASRLVTQMFLPQHPLNESDRWYRAVEHPTRLLGHGLVDELDRLVVAWDIVMGRSASANPSSLGGVIE